MDAVKKFVTLLIVFPCIVNGGGSITLDGAWRGTINYCAKSTSDDCTNEVTFPAQVPGGVYTDLTRVNLIEDNFMGDNDVRNRWVANRSVTYVREFHADENLANAPKAVLIFHGLDTFATIFLNDQEVGKASNMFLRYTFDVTRYLVKGKNNLKVSFSSAVRTAKELYDEQAANYVVPPECVPDNYNGECHVNHIRKMQASFSWDWGPAFPSMGIWKSVEIVPVNDLLVADTTTDVYKEGNDWKIVVTIFLETLSEEKSRAIPCNISYELGINETTSIRNSTNININTGDKYASTVISFNVPGGLVSKWWPNGYGDQKLYKLTVTVATLNGVTKRDTRVGFRTVELVQEPLKRGLSFYFRVNGVPIFAKGSNFIPASVFPELSAKEETVRHLLTSVKESHMNMLRVWGGGLYESELFYDLADEYGIMIWQDFMFACGMYPTAEEFLNSVREEVVQNVRRLKNHPSVVLWAGNNENEAALYGDWYRTGTKRVYRDDYVKLYVDLIKEEVERLDPTRPFVVSSPGNGAHAETYNYTGADPYSKFYGDVHYYNYFNNGWDIRQYPRARFSSEYGFQSMPSIYTIASVVDTGEDLQSDSKFMQHRQHLPLGTAYMKSLISRNFKIPETNNSVRDFIDFTYLSQINQAVSVRIQTEFYRQSMSELNEVGEGMTMGALYWQLNDVWQAPSWSSIDFDGRWKMLHYYATEFFAPIIVTSYFTECNDFSLYIVSDELQPVADASLEVNIYKWSNMTPVLSRACRNITIEANKAKRVDNSCNGVRWLDDALSAFGCGSEVGPKKSSIMTLTLKDKDGSQIAPINYVYPTAIKNVDLPVANVSLKINDYHLPGKYANYPDVEIELSTENIALFVWLEAGNVRGRFSENGFHMFESPRRIIFHSREMITPEILKENIKVTTVSDIYNENREVNANDVIRNEKTSL